MSKKLFCIAIFIFCLGLVITGCPKKTVVKEGPSVQKSEELRRQEAERATQEAKEAKEAKERELARMKEEEAKKAAEKEFARSLVAKKEPGIAGEVYESKLLKDIHFDFDKYDVRPEDVGILKENAAWLIKSPRVKIQIEGHCDERGTGAYNLALGERRANSTKNYLLTLGLSGDRISTISYGKERPLDPGHNEEAWSKNRRAHFIITAK